MMARSYHKWNRLPVVGPTTIEEFFADLDRRADALAAERHPDAPGPVITGCVSLTVGLFGPIPRARG